MSIGNFWDKIEPYLNTMNHAMIACATVYVTFAFVKLGPTVFSWHMWLCTMGYQLLMAEAIIGIYRTNSWSRLHSRRSKHNIHWIMQAVGSTMTIAGFLCEYLNRRRHYDNYHAFLGIISIGLMIAAFINGTLALWAPEIRRWIKPVYSKFFHNVVGIIAFAIGMASLSYGYELRGFRNVATVDIRLALRWVAWITCVLSLIGAARSLYEQTKGVILTTMNMFSSSSLELPLKSKEIKN